ncbi:MAG TPA: histidine kinase [Cyclobacteriaceae bacterium]|nr:histidine kinase [Cyclobacteriaceae bacterium]
MARIRRHILFWTAYVLFKTYLNVSDNLALPLSDYAAVILGQLTFLIVKIPLVYFCFYVIDRYLEMKWSLWQSIVVLMLSLATGSVGISLCNHLIVLPMILHIDSTVSAFAMASLVYHAFNLSFVTGAAISIRLFRRQHQSKMREVILQKEKTEAELKYLKAQINPHFLFNTLNNIYSLARKGSDQTSESILRLSKMMRFVLYEASHPRILLRDELTLIQDYIKLEELRYTSRLEVKYSESVDDPEQKIAPLLLINFVENAFKHGVSESRSESFVTVNIELTKKLLKATIVNSKPGEGKKNGTAIGMDNVKKQLNILYPQHRLDVRDETHKHSVELTISFND